MSYFSKERFSMKQIVIMLSVAMVLCAAYAFAVTLTNFSPGTTISSGDVNTNFQNLNNALPLMWASSDTAAGGVTLTNVGLTTVNTVSINAPTAGFLIISGYCFVNNAGTAGIYYLWPSLDGTNIIGSEAAIEVGANGSGTVELFNLAYTRTIPITAGAHTVAQEIGPSTGTNSFFYNRNNLTVMFVASSQGSLVTVSALEEPLSVGLSADGE